MRDKYVRGRKVFATLMVAYSLPTTVEHVSIHAFDMKSPLIRIRFQKCSTTIREISSTTNSDRMVLRAIPPTFNGDNDSDANSEEEQQRFDSSRSNRRRVRTLQRDDVVDDDIGDYNRASRKDNSDKDEGDFLRNDRFGYDRSTGTTEKEQFTDTDDWNDLDDDFDGEDEDEDYDDLDMIEAKRYDLLENIIIPNPLLDSMDPDGTVERLPELFSDPKFWFDMVLFILFLDFLSFAGPQSDPFIDFPWIY
jgi:hypothetical protein